MTKPVTEHADGKRAGKTNFDAVPDADDFVQEDPTPITDLNGMFDAVKQVKAVTNRLLKHDMPKIAKDAYLSRMAATEANEQVVIVRTRQEDLSARLVRMEKNGHPCVQTDKIARLQDQSKEWRQDKEEGIKTREMVKSAQEGIAKAAEEIGKAKAAPKRILASIFAVGLGMIGTVVAVAWMISGSLTTVQASIVTESAVRTVQFDSLKERIAQLPSKEDVPTHQQLETIKEVVVENGHSFVARCAKLTRAQKNYLKRQVERGMLPPVLRCPED